MNAHLEQLLGRIANRTAKVVGQGYVGLTVAMLASQQGFGRVVGFELSPARVKALSAGESYLGDISNDAPRSTPATCRRTTRPIWPGSTWRSSACRRRCARAFPT
jgi:UDP-N-acetyl-D-mannosaminuronate dehydrogenase